MLQCAFVHTYTMTATNLSTKQVAALKGVTVKTVNLWAQQGKLPIAETEKLSGARFFDSEVVAEFTPKTAPTSVTSPQKADVGVSSVGDAS